MRTKGPSTCTDGPSTSTDVPCTTCLFLSPRLPWARKSSTNEQASAPRVPYQKRLFICEPVLRTSIFVVLSLRHVRSTENRFCQHRLNIRINLRHLRVCIHLFKTNRQQNDNTQEQWVFFFLSHVCTGPIAKIRFIDEYTPVEDGKLMTRFFFRV